MLNLMATYRIQFCPAFPFTEAKKIVNYLHNLGISHLYASPIFQARKGSTHGYDIVDPNRINKELGGETEFRALVALLKVQNMGWIQDIVPNHMAYDWQNEMLMDVLESGQDSDFIDYFDINWDHTYANIKGRILAPFLGDFYNECLERGEIKLNYDQQGLSISYYTLRLPLNINSYISFFTSNLDQLKRKIGREDSNYISFLAALYSLKNLPSKVDVMERRDQLAFAKQMLWELYRTSPTIKNHIDTLIYSWNGEIGLPSSFDHLDYLLDEQYFNLSFWKVGAEEINYRRFFTINELISVKVEDEAVLDQTHYLIFRMLKQDLIQGIRIDHIDGLYEPVGYLHYIRRVAPVDTYIVVEKILEVDEDLPLTWPIQGTSGYEVLNQINGLLCQQKHMEAFTQIYQDFTRLNVSEQEVIEASKRLIIDRNLAGDIDNLAFLLKQSGSHHRSANDLTLYSLKKALIEVLVSFPIYRVYATLEGTLNPADQDYVKFAIAKAKESAPILDKELSFIERILLLQHDAQLLESGQFQWIHFARRFQQLSAPLMAKGAEDTAFYRYNRLIALNEVGGNLGNFGICLADFHNFNQKRQAHWPTAMSTTSTHDTKRGEDARARLQVLSELPEEWATQVHAWNQLNHVQERQRKIRQVPDRNDEYMLYQTLVGSFPFSLDELPEFTQRVKDYFIKAMREAKRHSAWLRPDVHYEAGALSFVDTILHPNHPFLASFLSFQAKIQHYGLFNALAQLLLKLTVPGVPDIYQGSELWDLSMVDPDNRRPVDYAQRITYLDAIQQQSGDGCTLLHNLIDSAPDGRIKLYILWRTLQVRRQYPELFHQGDYLPLTVVGSAQEQGVAFARSYGKLTAITVVPRFLTRLVTPGQWPLGAVWDDTRVDLPKSFGSTWLNVFSGQIVTVKQGLKCAEVFSHCPVALLIPAESRD